MKTLEERKLYLIESIEDLKEHIDEEYWDELDDREDFSYSCYFDGFSSRKEIYLYPADIEKNLPCVLKLVPVGVDDYDCDDSEFIGKEYSKKDYLKIINDRLDTLKNILTQLSD